MSKLDAFESELVQGCPEVSFDATILIGVVLDVLVDMLSNCGNDGVARASQALQKPNSRRTRFAVRKATRVAAERTETQLTRADEHVTQNYLLSSLSGKSQEEIHEILTETREVIEPFTFL